MFEVIVEVRTDPQNSSNCLVISYEAIARKMIYRKSISSGVLILLPRYYQAVRKVPTKKDVSNGGFL